MASKKAVIILLIVALLLSATATYITISKIGEAPLTGQFSNRGQIGVLVEPVRNVNVGVMVVPPEQEGEKKS